jgi:hypothetical protein
MAAWTEGLMWNTPRSGGLRRKVQSNCCEHNQSRAVIS